MNTIHGKFNPFVGNDGELIVKNFGELSDIVRCQGAHMIFNSYEIIEWQEFKAIDAGHIASFIENENFLWDEAVFWLLRIPCRGGFIEERRFAKKKS